MMHRTRRRVAITGTFAVLLAASVTVPIRGAAPAGGSFSPAGWLAEARSSHTATLLRDGRVLVVGGRGDIGPGLPSAELYDPAAGSSSPAGSLAEARTGHTATLLPGDRVLIVGGHGEDGPLASAELWDPVTGSFVPAGPLAEARTGHTATLLPDGVLIVGGEGDTADGGVPLASAERWDPVTGSFVAAGSLGQARRDHTATLLPDGGVLIVGGDTFNDDGRVPLAAAEAWDPVTESFVAAGSLAEARSSHTATLLPDGVLVVGGYGEDGPLALAELWDPVSGSFVPAGSLAEARTGHTATLLPDGVLIVGGERRGEYMGLSERWDPATGTFGPAASLAEARSFHTASLLPDGRVVVLGGGVIGADALASAEIWGPEAQPSSSPSATDDLDPALALLQLLNMPPAGIMETCRPGSPSLDGQLAVVQCSFGDDTVVYASFEGASSLAAAYDGIASSAAVEGGTSCSVGPFEGPYLAADGAEAGRVVCQASADGPLLGWTDERNLVLGFLLLGGGGGFAELHQHWLEVRLDAASTGGASPSPIATGNEIRQWAVAAGASSQYGTTDWSADQAAGRPDAPGYGGSPTSWAPASDPGDPEWIVLAYALPVVPTAVHIWEANGAGFVVQVEAWDAATSRWVTLWQGTDPTPEQLVAFSPPLTATDFPTQLIRVTAGEGASGYPYIDAVELVGIPAPE